MAVCACQMRESNRELVEQMKVAEAERITRCAHAQALRSGRAPPARLPPYVRVQVYVRIWGSACERACLRQCACERARVCVGQSVPPYVQGVVGGARSARARGGLGY